MMPKYILGPKLERFIQNLHPEGIIQAMFFYTWASSGTQTMGGHPGCRGGGGDRHWQSTYAPWLTETLRDSGQHQGFGVLSPQSARISLEGLGWGL